MAASATRATRVGGALRRADGSGSARTAARRGLSLSSFLCQTLWNEIERASDQHRVIALSVADSAAVDAVLADQEAPNEAMRAAVASYRERYGH